MSSIKITFIYNDEEKTVNKLDNFEECKKAFQEQFNLNDEEMKSILFFYFDEEDECRMNSNEDYNIFLDSGFTTIQAKLSEQKKNEFDDALRIGSVFKKREDQNKETISINLNDSASLDNSLSLENNFEKVSN